MYQILLVEDSLDYQNLVSKILEPVAKVYAVPTIADAIKVVKTNIFDLYLLDIMLPDGEGFELASIIKEATQNKEIPIVFLTGRGETVDKVKGFRLGADDYIVKPFDYLEFKARIESRLIKYKNRKEQQSETLTIGNLRLQTSLQKATLINKNSDLGLTPLEFKIIFCLASNQNEIISREKLVEIVWGKGIHIGRSIDTHVNALRKKMGTSGTCLKSSYGKGYYFRLDPNLSLKK
ncbi:MAG: response regulator transcription factor [Pseudomonadota bacterium]|nr:response regulator transcription factor [Pseudomonadota bacterium]